MADDKHTTTTNTTTTTTTEYNPGAFEPAATASSPVDDRRRSSDEWDASKVPPSRFQKRKGSIYAIPNSRDGHIDSNYASKFHEKHAEKGYHKTK